MLCTGVCVNGAIDDLMESSQPPPVEVSLSFAAKEAADRSAKWLKWCRQDLIDREDIHTKWARKLKVDKGHKAE